MKNNKKGFTLIELIVVLAILAVIAAIAVPTAFGAITDAQTAADTASVEGFNSAIRMQATLLRGNATIDEEKNKVSVAITNAAMADFKPQADRNIYWIAPTDTSVGYLAMADVKGGGGTKIELKAATNMTDTIKTALVDAPIIKTGKK
ncbi:MAG: prepilin-type N-terminal cleavage/methylation domain-containing protein [Oscillospiraceae bacterium]